MKQLISANVKNLILMWTKRNAVCPQAPKHGAGRVRLVSHRLGEALGLNN